MSMVTVINMYNQYYLNMIIIKKKITVNNNNVKVNTHMK